MTAPRALILTARELPVLQERETWICVRKPASITKVAYEPIAQGSAIVAAPMGVTGDYVKVYFEGNLYRAINQHQYEERLVCAWGRLVFRYPTIAMMGHSMAEFIDRYDVVGVFDGKRSRLILGHEDRLIEVQKAYIEHWSRPSAAAGALP